MGWCVGRLFLSQFRVQFRSLLGAVAIPRRIERLCLLGCVLLNLSPQRSEHIDERIASPNIDSVWRIAHDWPF
jgi:hypothetical protein